ncbi:MAG: MarR family transcriptional regulator [bacterium]
MSRRIDFYIDKLEWLGPILVRGLGLLSSAEALEQSFSFSQVMVLQTLQRSRSMKMTELARFLGLSKTNATGLVDRLVRRGMVRRDRSEEDRRVVFVSLTPDGRRAAARLTITSRKGLTALMKRVPEENLGPFIATLEQLALGLAETSGSAPPPAGPPR